MTMMDFETFQAAAKEAVPNPQLWRELQALFAQPQGTLRVLVKAILEQRQTIVEALVATHMVDDVSIRRAVGTQGQVSGIDIVLQTIFEAMRKPDEPADEVSSEQRPSAP